MRQLGVAILLSALVTCAYADTQPAQQPKPTGNINKHVIIISIDVLTPQIYLNPSKYRNQIPNIVKLMENGSYAQKINPVTPLLSYPNHVSLVTGTTPDKHGITSNTGPNGEDLILDARRVQTITIWDAAASGGLTTAAINWPITYAAKLNYLIPQNLNGNTPEVDTDFSVSTGNLEKLIEAGSYPKGMYQELKKNIPNVSSLEPLNDTIENSNNLNYMSTAFAAEIIKLYKPNLLLIHFTDRNSPQNINSSSKEETVKMLSQVDKYIGNLMDAVQTAGLNQNTTYVLISSEHAAQQLRMIINPQTLVLEAINDLQSSAGKTNAHSVPATKFPSALTVKITNSGRGVIIMPSSSSNPDLARKQLAQVKKNIETKYNNYITYSTNIPQDVVALRDRSVLAYLAAKPGCLFTLQQNPENKVLTLPTPEMRPMIYTGFIISGDNIISNVMVPIVNTIDIAPTIAKILGISLPTAQGKVMTQLLIPQPNTQSQQPQTN